MRQALQLSALAGAAYTYQDFSDADVVAYADALEQPLMQEVYELLERGSIRNHGHEIRGCWPFAWRSCTRLRISDAHCCGLFVLSAVGWYPRRPQDPVERLMQASAS